MKLENDEDLNSLEDDQSSLYLRRAKAIPVRRRRLPRRGRRLTVWAGFVMAALIPAGLAGYKIARYALSSPRFRVTSASEITIHGNRFVSPAQILAVMDIPPDDTRRGGVNIFRISLSSEARRVESIPWIKSATLARSLPHHLAIYVTERVPVAFVDLGGKIKLVDSDGVILDSPAKTTFDFPVLEGLSEDMTTAERSQRVRVFCKFIQETEHEVPASGWMVSEVRLKDPDDLQALVVRGSATLLLDLGRHDFAKRFANFLSLLPELEKHSDKIASVDLRYGNQVVVRPALPDARGTARQNPFMTKGSGIRD